MRLFIWVSVFVCVVILKIMRVPMKIPKRKNIKLWTSVTACNKTKDHIINTYDLVSRPN